MALGILDDALACLEALGFMHKWPDSLNIKKWHESFILVTFQIGDYSFKPWHYGLIFSIQLCLLHLHYKYNTPEGQIYTHRAWRIVAHFAQKTQKLSNSNFKFQLFLVPNKGSKTFSEVPWNSSNHYQALKHNKIPNTVAQGLRFSQTCFLWFM